MEKDLPPPRRSGFFFWFKLLVGLALLTLAGFKLHDLYEDWQQNPQQVSFNGYAFALAAAVYLGALLLTFYRWFVLVRTLDLPFGYGDSLRLGFVGYVSSLLAPGSVTGDLVKMGFIATEQKRRAAAIATIVADRILGLYALFLVSALMGCIFWREAWPNNWLRANLFFIWGVTAVGGTALLILLYVPHPFDWLVPRLGRFSKVARVLGELAESLQQYRYRPAALLWALLLGMIGHSGFVLSFYLCALALSGPVAPPSLSMHFLFIPIGMVVQAVPLTPGGNAGVNENFFDWLYKQVNPNFPLGVLISLLQRAVTWTVGLIGLFWYIPLRHAMKRAQLPTLISPSEVTVDPSPAPPLTTQEVPHETVS